MAQAKDRAPRPGARKAKARDKKEQPAGPSRASSAKPAGGTRKAGAARAGAARSAGTASRRSATPPKPKPKRKPEAARVLPAASPPRAGRKSGRPQAKTRSRRTKPEAAPADATLELAGGEATLGDEERIEAAKYLPVATKARVFEEERFLFPESYGVDRVRLHVKDPEWLFAYWDIAPASLTALRQELGERGLALSRVTLRVVDTGNGGASVILLPPGARSWYVRTARGRRSYRAELGLTLPSGEFRRLAESNTVVAPRGERSTEKASVRRSYRKARAQSAEVTAAAARAEAAVEAGAEPWSVPPQDAGVPITPSKPEGGKAAPGGASDAFRR